MKTIKVRLRPTDTQLIKLFQSSSTHRFIYNWTLARQKENYKYSNKFLTDSVLRKEITQLKKTDDFKWLSDVSNDIPKQAVKDACQSYKRFFKGLSKPPKFKSKRKSRPSFYNDTSKLKVSENSVMLSKIGWVKTSEQLPTDVKYYNPRITFDGKYWYISLSIDEQNEPHRLNDISLGIDLGVKDLAICSDGKVFRNINKSNTVKKTEKRLRRLQRKVSRKYQMNRKGGTFPKTCNIIKIEKEICLLQRTLTNIRRNHLHQSTTSIVKTKPRRIVIEDLNVKGMMKNKHLSKHIQKQGFYEFRRQLTYKCEWYGIELVVADRYYPSSKTCYACGNIKKDLKLSDRLYSCECGYTMDRDFECKYEFISV